MPHRLLRPITVGVAAVTAELAQRVGQDYAFPARWSGNAMMMVGSTGLGS